MTIRAKQFCENAACAKELTSEDIESGDGLCAFCEEAERVNAAEWEAVYCGECGVTHSGDCTEDQEEES